MRCPAPACQPWTYLNAKPSGSAVIARGDAFLALHWAQAPALGRWDLPGGFCDADEHPGDTAVRETAQETGLKIYLRPLIGLYLGHYPWQGETHSTLNVYYLANLADKDAQPQMNDESLEAAWIPLHDTPGLAFEHQNLMLTDAV
ncbi:NUDIX hydrolase [Kineosporia babensis]|uniref:NUDIX hydrolase n=1 Tax=Kineosporia babensis TaxID=499548 RepID=A0A9X1NNA0_9ACTN|nr:NUDIX hydrolase [Kineosporia babensis]